MVFTYKTFTNTKELLNLLKERYLLEPPDLEEEQEITISTQKDLDVKKQFDIYLTGMRRKIYSLINDWIRFAPEDFQGESTQIWQDFISVIEKEHKTKGIYYRQILEDIQKQEIELSLATSITEIKSMDTKFTFFDFEPTVLALQMTLLQYENLKKIKRDELMNQIWLKEPEKANNVLAFVQTFNNYSNWVVSEIVKCGKLANRIKVLSYFIKIILEFEKLNNYDGIFAIIAALNRYKYIQFLFILNCSFFFF